MSQQQTWAYESCWCGAHIEYRGGEVSTANRLSDFREAHASHREAWSVAIERAVVRAASITEPDKQQAGGDQE